MQVKGYPYVLVPGMGGWGETSSLSRVLPYWGFSHFDIVKILNARGFETYAASIPPMGSAWDRTCELYAQLTGTRVDYGAAHSARFGHARYGRTYEKPLFPGWGEKDENGRVKKVNFISHSFGGVTARMLATLLADGCAEEREATMDGSLSPLFEGGHGGRIFSIATISAPHDGTDMQFALPAWLRFFLQTVYYEASHITSCVPALRGVFDAQLGQFGVGGKGSFFSMKEFRRFKNSGDNVFYDVCVDGSKRINRSLRALEDVYYFSFAVCGTHTARTGEQEPKLGVMLPGLFPMAHYMGRYTEVTPDGFVVDASWKPNDGVVNTRSAMAPADEPSVPFDPKQIEKGVWNVMPVIEGDHASVIGWFRDKKTTMPLYCKHVRRIEALCARETINA
ncbi:MAG: lipase [Clostridia bacterium]|nr:lipase [Clostridia bacterium]